MSYALTRDVPQFLAELSDLFEKHGMVLISREEGQRAFNLCVQSYDTGRFMANVRLRGRLEIEDRS